MKELKVNLGFKLVIEIGSPGQGVLDAGSVPPLCSYSKTDDNRV